MSFCIKNLFEAQLQIKLLPAFVDLADKKRCCAWMKRICQTKVLFCDEFARLKRKSRFGWLTNAFTVSRKSKLERQFRQTLVNIASRNLINLPQQFLWIRRCYLWLLIYSDWFFFISFTMKIQLLIHYPCQSTWRFNELEVI
jgi:hypothetical protein